MPAALLSDGVRYACAGAEATRAAVPQPHRTQRGGDAACTERPPCPASHGVNATRTNVPERGRLVTRTWPRSVGGTVVQISPLAGRPAPEDLLVDIDALVKAYYAEHPDPADPAQRVSFGTSGHRGSALARAFNEDHILAITQAICEYRTEQGVSGPLFIGVDTHGLSEPAL